MSYSIFVRFRKSRLPLARGIDSFESALQRLESFRRERLHGRDDVFIVDDASGQKVLCESEMVERR